MYSSRVEDWAAKLKAHSESSVGQWKAKWQACMSEKKRMSENLGGDQELRSELMAALEERDNLKYQLEHWKKRTVSAWLRLLGSAGASLHSPQGPPVVLVSHLVRPHTPMPPSTIQAPSLPSRQRAGGP